MAVASRPNWITACRISSYARNNESSTLHQFLARAGAEVLPEHFFIDVASSQTQRIVNTDGVRVNNNYAITGNRTDQLTASVRPSWYQPIGSYAEALLDYEHAIVRFDKDAMAGSSADSRLDSASLTINSLAGARRLSWKFNAQGQRTVYDDSAFDDLKTRNAGVAARLPDHPEPQPPGPAWLRGQRLWQQTQLDRSQGSVLGCWFPLATQREDRTRGPCRPPLFRQQLSGQLAATGTLSQLRVVLQRGNQRRGKRDAGRRQSHR